MGKIINSFEREFGKNAGKVASNILFGNMHSTPYRRVYSQRKINNTTDIDSNIVERMKRKEMEAKTFDKISELANLEIMNDKDYLYSLLSKLTTLMSAHKWKVSGGIENKYNDALLQKSTHAFIAIKSIEINSEHLRYYDKLIKKYRIKRFIIRYLYLELIAIAFIIYMIDGFFIYLSESGLLVPFAISILILTICFTAFYLNTNGKAKSTYKNDASTKDFIDLNNQNRIENRLNDIWNRYTPIIKQDFIKRKPIFSSEGIAGSILFIGINPSFDPNDDNNLINTSDNMSLQYYSFYKMECAPRYFKRLEDFAKQCGAAYTHINLLYARENDRELLLSSNADFIREQLELTYDTILNIQPSVIIMFSDYCKNLVFGKSRWIYPSTLSNGHYTLNGTSYPVFFVNDITTLNENELKLLAKKIME